MYKAGDKVVIRTGEHAGKRGRVASVNPDNTDLINYVKIFGSVVRYHWFSDDDLFSASSLPQVLGKSDPVNHPDHYTWMPNGFEVIDLTELFNFNRGNALKYVLRAGRKTEATELEDLRKARWYIDREISRMENSK